MNTYNITKKYYSHWLDVDNKTLNGTGIISRESEIRENTQVGYSTCFSLYVYRAENLSIISYRNSLQDKVVKTIDLLEKENSLLQLKTILTSVFGKRINHSIKFVYTGEKNDIDISDVKKLSLDNYTAYCQFYIKAHNIKEEPNWLKEYFVDNINKETMYAYFIGNNIISCTDGPDMPFMQDVIQTIGINTLLEYRGRGYATISVLKCIENMIGKSICPMWSCSSGNIASAKLAERVGFRKLADILTVSGE